ncbi:MAG TPA: hypothetical protein VFQ65_26745, partial [Kofleriaceae bacterium]|nr:hypothetical protein [Kofleriaceae bacterium]
DGITEGTPLFVTSVLDDLLGRGMVAERDGRWQLTAGSEEVAAHRPDSIRQMIDMRLDRLTLDEQRLLEAASLVGIDVSIGVVAAALELPLETVDENADGLARRALFLRREPVEEWPDGALHTRYAFTHGLVREVCRDRSAPARRERWHRNIASHLEASGRGDVALRLASHFEDGHLPERALRCYIQAAAQAMSRFASEDAMHLCARAEQLLPRIAEERTRDALELDLLDSQSLIAMRRFQDLTRDPAELLQRRIVLARRFSDQSRVCLALLDLALLHSIRAQHDAVVALLSEVDTLLLDTTVAPAIHLYVDSTRAMSMFWQGRVRDSQALFSRVFSTPIPEDAPSLLMQDLLDRRSMMLGYLSGICWMTGEPDRAIREVQEAFDLANSKKDAYAIGLAGTMLTWLQFARRDPAGSPSRNRRASPRPARLRTVARAMRHSRRMGQEPHRDAVRPRSGRCDGWLSITDLGQSTRAQLTRGTCPRSTQGIVATCRRARSRRRSHRQSGDASRASVHSRSATAARRHRFRPHRRR